MIFQLMWEANNIMLMFFYLEKWMCPPLPPAGIIMYLQNGLGNIYKNPSLLPKYIILINFIWPSALSLIQYQNVLKRLLKLRGCETSQLSLLDLALSIGIYD